MELLQNCANCAHYDGDGFCALPMDEKLIHGYIEEAESVACAAWAAKARQCGHPYGDESPCPQCPPEDR